MSDCEEADFWESWISPVKTKRKKEAKKNNSGQKFKKTNDIVRKKKKKKKKFKEAMQRRKEKKKEKKKKMALDLDDSFVSECGSTAALQAKPEALNLRSSAEKLKPDPLTPDSKKKTKRKKKVMFDLSPGYIVPSSLQSSIESVLLENEFVKDVGRCSPIAETGQNQGPPQDPNSQCSVDNMNSQDLFITQKTFRGSPSDSSSGEPDYKAVIWTPQMLMLTEGSQNENGSPKEKRELNTNLTEEKDVPCPSPSRPYVEPIVVTSSPDVKSKKQAFSCPSYTHERPLLPLTSTTIASTQTENFFTTELSSYLNFQQKSTSTLISDDVKPLDLSLPKRAKKDLKISATKLKGDEEKSVGWKQSCLLKEVKSDRGARPSCSSEARKEPCGRQRRSISAKSKGESTPSPESESKSTDTTTSSEDYEHPCRGNKVDLTQVRAVQMRLNESFFFKTKGEGSSPRAESPLMKLAQGRDVKSRKRH
ncbi:uncharacterized protein LOC121897147 [Scomber scombrus]|uniref:Uncharacterized protein LOC121897147 n=1 Tax=Scomber scombrus TaxID=13677 RepID=A0AAV1PEW4_SCOSC